MAPHLQGDRLARCGAVPAGHLQVLICPPALGKHLLCKPDYVPGSTHLSTRLVEAPLAAQFLVFAAPDATDSVGYELPGCLGHRSVDVSVGSGHDLFGLRTSALASSSGVIVAGRRAVDRADVTRCGARSHRTDSFGTFWCH